MIKARAWSDDRNVDVEFDATPYFQQAGALEILQLACCGWAGDYPADDVATYVAGGEPSTGRDGRPGLRRLFQYLEIIADDPAKADCRGFECQVDRQTALDWVRVHRPRLVQALHEVEQHEVQPEEAMERLPGKRFQVLLARTETRHAVAVVEAVDEKHARTKALDQAGDVDFSCGTAGQPEYSVKGVDELDQSLPESRLREFAQQLLRNAKPELQDGLARLAPRQVITRLGPYAVKDASQIHETGYDVISDPSFINVASLHEAEQLCQALNAIYEQDKEDLDCGRENPCARRHEDADPHASRSS